MKRYILALFCLICLSGGCGGPETSKLFDSSSKPQCAIEVRKDGIYFFYKNMPVVSEINLYFFNEEKLKSWSGEGAPFKCGVHGQCGPRYGYPPSKCFAIYVEKTFVKGTQEIDCHVGAGYRIVDIKYLDVGFGYRHFQAVCPEGKTIEP